MTERMRLAYPSAWRPTLEVEIDYWQLLEARRELHERQVQENGEHAERAAKMLRRTDDMRRKLWGNAA